MPPVTATKWRNVKQAVEFGPVCPQQPPQIRNESAALQNMGKGRLRALKQIVPQLKNQSEDCLYLNVYAPLSGKNHISKFQNINFLFSFIITRDNPLQYHVVFYHTTVHC